MPILARYLIGRVLWRFVVIAVVLSLVFGGYTVALYLSRAAAGLIRPEFVLELVALKALIATEIVVPISLYAAVFFAVERLRRDNETTALLALGFGPRQARRVLLPLFIVIGLVVAWLSLFVRPATYARLFDLRLRAETAFEILDVEPQRFYVDLEDGNWVVLADERGEDGSLGGIFIWSRRGNGEEVVVRAKALRPRADATPGNPAVTAEALQVWRIDEAGSRMAGSSGSLETELDFGGVRGADGGLKSLPTSRLADSVDPEHVAERQWRWSRGASAILLGLLALRAAGWSRPAGRRLPMILIAIGSCLAYYFVSITARAAVREGTIGAAPGLYWVEAALLVTLVAIWTGTEKRWRKPRMVTAES